MADVLTTHSEGQWSILEWTGAFVAAVVMSVYAITMLGPLFFINAPLDASTRELMKDNQGTVNIITTAVVMFFFGASVGRRMDQNIINTQAKTNAAAQAALAPLPGVAEVIPVAPGETVTVAGTEDKEPPL